VEDIEEFLQHYGVLGMRWGVSKRSGGGGGGPTPIKVNARPGQKIITTGGHKQPSSEDAKLTAAIRQKARASGPQSLSNNEMRTLVERMNLEQQYARLNPKQKSLGEKFAEALLKDPKAVKDPRLEAAIKIGEAFAKATKGKK
jgi:hypothetical protein